MSQSYDAVLLLSFGGPEKHDDVIPFLENVLRGRNVPRERMLEVAEHYYHFDGRSPINQQNRELVAALKAEIEAAGLTLPVYWGNRNWHPFLPDTLQAMQADGVRKALVYVTSAFGSYSGCRQYLEDMEKARAGLGAGAPELVKLRGFFNHPGFIECLADRLNSVLAELPVEDRGEAEIVFTAHSVPNTMAETSPYVGQLKEACNLVASACGRPGWELAYQSRSGPPTQPWLEPDILDVVRSHAGRRSALVVVPIGFVSDHMEVLYDLDTEARQVAAELGVRMFRAATPGTHPRFVRMIRELVEEQVKGTRALAVGKLPPRPAFCPADCCPAPQRPIAQSRFKGASGPPADSSKLLL